MLLLPCSDVTLLFDCARVLREQRLFKFASIVYEHALQHKKCTAQCVSQACNGTPPHYNVCDSQVWVRSLDNSTNSRWPKHISAAPLKPVHAATACIILPICLQCLYYIAGGGLGGDVFQGRANESVQWYQRVLEVDAHQTHRDNALARLVACISVSHVY